LKVLLSWLQEFAPDIAGDPVELGEDLSALGLAVEDIELIGQGLGGVVVAKVLDLRPHPNADKIQIVDVDAGDGEALQVCCGAFNMSVGDIIPFATIGTVMPNGMEIGRRKMRGEWSNGMCCSGAEIGFGDDHDGIMLLSGAPALGTPIYEALGVEADVLYDLEVNPNRPDAMSIMGVARDLSAWLKVPFTVPQPTVAESGTSALDVVKVTIDDPDLCGRFTARVLRGVTVGESDRKVANRLRALGMRPINSLVDLSNYVMLELGQPNHTFDLDKVPDGALIVRRARAGEKIVTLDGAERELFEGDGIITDEDDTPVSIAGVMGGASTEISESTSNVLLEMAWWDPPSIARMARRLGLRSEASARFERGADPEIADLAMRRFAELAGVDLAPGMIDEVGNLPTTALVRLRSARVNAILGTDLSADDIAGHLSNIGFGVTPVAVDDAMDHDVTIPSFRPDSSTEIDLIEEVGRMHGYANIARTVPQSPRSGALTPRQHDRRLLRQALIGYGLNEAMPLPFLAPDDLAKAGLPDEAITITNPLVTEESMMRTSLMPGLLKAVAFNESHRILGVRLFEIGHVYLEAAAGQDLPNEREHLAVMLAGNDAHEAVELLSVLADSIGLPAPELTAAEVPGVHPTRGATVSFAGVPVGSVGEVDPDAVAAFDVDQRVGWLELDLTAMLEVEHGARPYRRVSRFPSSDVDLAFVVADDVAASAVTDSLWDAGGDLLSDLRLFDVFRDAERLGADRRSLAYTLRFQAPDHTLTDEETGTLRTACIDAVVAQHGAELRA